MTSTDTREQWLQQAVEVFRPRFEEVGYPLPATVRISVGFAYGTRAESGTILGVTYNGAVVEDGVFEIFISPEDADTASMLETVLHELIHVVVFEDGHKKRFAEIATRLGFEGPMTATPPSVELAAELITIAATLGPYPGSKITIPKRSKVPAPVPVGPSGKPIKVHTGAGTQTNRQMKCVCPGCGWTFRAARSWIEKGLPTCACGEQFVPKF